jgi:hypothetical protein
MDSSIGNKIQKENGLELSVEPKKKKCNNTEIDRSGDQYASPPTTNASEATTPDSSVAVKRSTKSHLSQFKKILPFIKISKKIKQK